MKKKDLTVPIGMDFKKMLSIMRLTTFLLLIGALNIYAGAYSQDAKISVNIQNGTLTDLFNAIEQNTEFKVFYKSKLINESQKLNLTSTQTPVSELLTVALSGRGLTYDLVDKIIVITPGEPTRQQKITGTVVDATTGEAIIGANVILEGTKIAVQTDANGKFSMEVSKSDAVLVISYLGYTTEKISLAGQANIEVKLIPDVKKLDEIVVIGYGTLKKSDLTGAITQIDPTKKEERLTANATDLLRNTVAGMNIPFSTSAKGDINTDNILIRGRNSIKASTGPLIVLDGTIWEGDLADISSSDIARIDVMKDASSAAVYGSRASNGVIQITTKKGASGAPTITLSSNFGFNQASKLRKVLDGPGYVNMRMNLMKAVRGNVNTVNGVNYYDDPSSLSGADLDTWMAFSKATGNPTNEWLTRLNFYPVEIENYNAGRTIDWAKLIFQTGFKQDYNMNISGGNDRTKYYFSTGYTNTEGFVIGDKYEAIRSRMNLETKLNKLFTVGTNAQFAVRNQGSIPVGTQYNQMSPYSSLYDANGVMKQFPFDNGGQDGGSNPLLTREYSEALNKTYDLNSKIWGMINLPLNITYTLNIVNNFTVNKDYRHDSSNSPANTSGGYAYRNNNSSYTWTIENLLKWNKTFGKHVVDVTLMQNVEKYQSWFDGMSNSGFDPTDLLGYHGMGFGKNPIISSNDETDSRDALLARLNYTFNDRYYLTTAVRQDGYSAFGQANPHATFPTMALGWRLSNESFFKVNWVDNLKLRLSWGANGNSAIGRYDAMATMGNIKILQAYAASGAYYTQSGLTINRLANENLQWEKTTSANLGLDFNLFGNRVNGSAEYYLSETTNLLLDRQLPSIVGVKSVASNMGQVNNKGWEITLNTLNIDLKNKFQWNTSLTLSGFQNKIVHLYGDYDANGVEQDDTQNGWYIGHPIDAVYDYKSDGIWQKDELEAARAEGKPYAGYFPGDYKMVDVNGDGKYLPEDDRQFLGHKNPNKFINITNDFTFFNDISFSFTLYGAFGGIKNYNYEHFGALTLSDFDLPYWTEDNRSNKYPRMSERDIDAVTTTNYIKTDFIRLSNISLGYNLNSKIVNRFGLKSAKLYCNVENVAVWSPWPVWDPENTGGPVPRKFNFGINLKF